MVHFIPSGVFNGILGSYHTNNRSIEIQLVRKFLTQTKVKDFSYPEMYQDSFMEFFFYLPEFRVSQSYSGANRAVLKSPRAQRYISSAFKFL